MVIRLGARCSLMKKKNSYMKKHYNQDLVISESTGVQSSGNLNHYVGDN
jgi:hypothetical protein